MGKVQRECEFGCTVPVVSTMRWSWVIGIDAPHGKPYDRHTPQ
jgi:IS5 family transposase